MRKSVWDEMLGMHDEMESLFNSLYRYPIKKLAGPEMEIKRRNLRTPICDMGWNKENLVTRFELPGVEKQDIDLNIGEGFMEVKVVNQEKIENKETGHEYQYFQKKQFYRRVSLPETVNVEKAVAEFKNGMLEVKFPKSELEEKKFIKLEIK